MIRCLYLETTMKKILLLIASLIIIGAGCKSGQYPQPGGNMLTSSIHTTTGLTSTQNSTGTNNNAPENPILKLAKEARKKINLTKYEILSRQLLAKQNILFFTLIINQPNSTSAL